MSLLNRLDNLINQFTVVNEKNSEDKYEELFRKKLKEWGIKSPDELSKKEKDKFFKEIEYAWTKEKD